MTSFRESTDSTEIHNLFKLLRNNQASINIWQTHFHQRQMATAQLKSVEQDHLLVTLTNKLELIPERHIYFYCEYKKIVFKIKHYHLKENSLKIVIPKEITLEELRAEKRFNLFNTKNTLIELEKNAEKTFSARPYDLSSNGISFLMPMKNKEELELNDVILLKNIIQNHANQYKDAINLTGKVVHIQPYSSKSELMKVPTLKIGVQLSTSLDLNTLHIFRQLLLQ